MTGLSDATSYTFTVTALNSFGFGVSSQPSSEAMVSSATGAPSAPRDVVASARDQRILVSFNPPANDGGSPITGYKITANPVPPSTPEISGASLGCLIGFQGYCLLYPPGTQSTPVPSGAWQMELTGAQDSFILHISCASPTSCIAVGATATIGGSSLLSYVPYVVATNNAGATWNEVPFPSAPGMILTSVSCTSATSCVAGGFPAKLSLSVKPEIFYTSDAGATWKAASVPSSLESLGGISCVASSSTCFAVGLVGIASSEVVESTDAGATWQSTKGAPPAGIVSLLVPLITGNAISCASVSTCTFVGVKADVSLTSLGLAPMSVTTTNAGATWNANAMGPAEGPGALEIPSGISCASTVSCTAIGTSFLGAQTSTAWQTSNAGVTWAQENPIAGLGTYAHAFLYSVSCATASTCYVAGSSIGSSSVVAPVLEGTSDNGAIWQPENVATQANSVLGFDSVSCAPTTTTCKAGGLIGSSHGLQAAIAGAESCGTTGALCTTLSTSVSLGAQYQVPDAINATTYQVSVTALNANGFSLAGAAVYQVTPLAVPMASYGTGAPPVQATLIGNPTNGFSYTSELLLPAQYYNARNVDRDCGQSSRVNIPTTTTTTTRADLWVFCDTITHDFGLITSPSPPSGTKQNVYHFTPSGTAAVQDPLPGPSVSPQLPLLTEDVNTGTLSKPSWPYPCPYSTVGETSSGLASPIAPSQPCPFLPSEGPKGTSTLSAWATANKLTVPSVTISAQNLLEMGVAPSYDPDNDSDNDASPLRDTDAKTKGETPIPLTDYCMISANELTAYDLAGSNRPADCANLSSAGFVIVPGSQPLTTTHYQCMRWTAGLMTRPVGAFLSGYSASLTQSNKVLDYYQHWCIPQIKLGTDATYSDIVFLSNGTAAPLGWSFDMNLETTWSPSVGVGEVNVTGSTTNQPSSIYDNLFPFPSSSPQELNCSGPGIAKCDTSSPATPQDGFASGAVLGPNENHLYIYTPVGNWSHYVYLARINLSLSPKGTTTGTTTVNTSVCGTSFPVWACAANYKYYDTPPPTGSTSICPSTPIASSASWTTNGAEATPILATCPIPPFSSATTAQQAVIGGGTFSVSKVPTQNGTEYIMVYQPVGGPYSGEVQFAVASDPWGPFTLTTSAVIPGCSPTVFATSCYDYLLHPELDPTGNTNLVFSYFQRGTYNAPNSGGATGHVQFAMLPMNCVVAPDKCSTGYWEVAADGGIFPFGGAQFYGSMGGKTLKAPVVGIAATPDGKGYWEVAADGGIFAFGDAGFYGSMGGKTLKAPVVGIAATPDGKGYWEVAADGGIFAFGDAGFYGSMGGKPLNKPVVGITSTPDGGGYWEVAADGGIFAFGDAGFYGSMGGKPLNKPVVGITSTPDGGGYWEVASDGGIFAFGDAGFYGSMGAKPLNAPIVGIASTSDGFGYWEVASDGGIFAYLDAHFYGSMGGKHLNAPVVGMAASSEVPVSP